MPFAQALLRLSSFATRFVPTPLPAQSRDVAIAEAADALARAAIGRWASEDSGVVIELRPDGRYNEAQPGSAAWRHGRYELDRNLIYFESDSGDVAKGEMTRGVLRVGSVAFRRGYGDASDQAALARG
ncbi:hypothetical protein IP69_12320 [Bosea sp. AAP35]|uniref:Atu4866 domain-containing protein n=1 Tax=Bosea sp. AAP35 TaxID=1523417 RepID=UPI0006B9CD27|nr:Atu4866 domain-containing protein [Bosea sp. AAP35]KPF67829.1 hypothetical protein IP69_12320 [Bosea sp. AAP35]